MGAARIDPNWMVAGLVNVTTHDFTYNLMVKSLEGKEMPSSIFLLSHSCHIVFPCEFFLAGRQREYLSFFFLLGGEPWMGHASGTSQFNSPSYHVYIAGEFMYLAALVMDHLTEELLPFSF